MPAQTINKNDQAPEGIEPTAPEHQAFPLEEVMKAQSALRSAARMPPERYPLPQIIGMLSDEIEALRTRGLNDTEIATLIGGNSLIKLEAETIGKYYASPEQRGKAPEPGGTPASH